jgi:(p)ppGpp synthase/HD superfamily hydrolase
MSVILNAAKLAVRYHQDQLRDNGLPYLTHLIRVGGRATTRHELTEEDVAGAFLHDIIEDQAYTAELHDEIVRKILKDCGVRVLSTVISLTNPSKGSTLSRAERKAEDRKHMAGQARNVKIIKLIDRIDNVNELAIDMQRGVEKRYDFVLTFCDESDLLLKEALTGVAADLENELALAIINLRKTLP